MRCLSAAVLVLLVSTETASALKMINVTPVGLNEILDNYIPGIMSQKSRNSTVNDESVPKSNGATTVEDHQDTFKSVMQNLVQNETNTFDGRKLKLKKMYLKLVLGLKLLAVGVILPAAVALSLLQSWKALTLSLMAFGLGTILGIKGLLHNGSSGKAESSSASHHLVHSYWPPKNHHEHYWRTIREKSEVPIIISEPYAEHMEELSAHDLAYRKGDFHHVDLIRPKI